MLSIKFLSLPVALSCVMACSSGAPGEPEGEGNGQGEPTTALAAGIKVSEVAFYQGPKISLMKDGVAPARIAPAIQGRPGFLRVFLSRELGSVAREVTVRLDLTAGGVALPPMEQKLTPALEIIEANLAASANFEIGAEQVTADLTWKVSVRENAPGPALEGPVDAAQFPTEGQQSLDASDSGEALEVVIVPVRYDADGSGRLPDTSPEMLERLRAEMFALYPVRKVDITVTEELPWTKVISPSGSGWGGLLNTIIRKRLTDGVPSRVYYYGMLAPAVSMTAFCSQGCVAGMSPVSDDPRDDYARGSIGLGYGGKTSDAHGTFVHEVGHAHGREHANCGLGGQPYDYDYPYSNGKVGVWSYHLSQKTWLDPAKTKDMMSYCNPIAVSDYTYNALYERVSFLNLQTRILGGAPSGDWKSYVIEGDQVTAGETVTLRAAPRGVDRLVDRVSADGKTTEQVTAKYYPFNHIPGGILLVPGSVTTTGLKFEGRTLR